MAEEFEELGGLDEDVEMETLQLRSKEGELFEVRTDVAMQSELVMSMFESDRNERVIPMQNVSSAVLEKVIEYLKHHHNNPAKPIEQPLRSKNLADVVDAWDADFVSVPQEVLFELMLAANYMDIKPLLDLTCAQVASMIKGKSPDEIRKTFNIPNDFTPEEEEAVRQDFRWAESI
ncbi:MAG: hypothetical protein MHM6MM_008846 [Cercozoa sp. M6MM]